jgi:hypothetical protein
VVVIDLGKKVLFKSVLAKCCQVCFHFEKLVDDEVVNVSEKKVKLVEIKLPQSLC